MLDSLLYFGLRSTFVLIRKCWANELMLKVGARSVETKNQADHTKEAGVLFLLRNGASMTYTWHHAWRCTHLACQFPTVPKRPSPHQEIAPQTSCGDKVGTRLTTTVLARAHHADEVPSRLEPAMTTPTEPATEPATAAVPGNDESVAGRSDSGEWSTDRACIVCFGDYAPGDMLCRLPCRHVYHAEVRWVLAV